MASWSEFSAASPGLAEAIRGLIEQYGAGLGYLATVRADGGPRVHPVSPVITDDGLFCFVLDSPKRRDLERDGRYALHSFPPEDSDDEAYLAGHARPVIDPAEVHRVATRVRAAPYVDWQLFEFTVEVAMVARHERSAGLGRGMAAASRPTVQLWHDPARRPPAQRAGAGPANGTAAGRRSRAPAAGRVGARRPSEPPDRR
jgi:Pyridoxamine 5'-phosphate oxidase